jgi:predicted DNA-binding transcriptional regulator YafY
MRSSRLLSILIMLQLRTRLTAVALAEEFEVSVRTIYRDIDALSAAGVPVYGDRGPGGGFQLLDGYRTRLTGLDQHEAEAMLLAGLPEQARALGIGDAASAARNKLLAALPDKASTDADRTGQCFHIDMVDWYRNMRPVPFLAPLARAVLDTQRVAMTYESWTATRDWDVAPLGLVLKGGGWYLAAIGHDKPRIFNVADIKALTVLVDRFDRPPQFDLPTWWGTEIQSFETRLRPERAVLRLSPEGLRLLRKVGAYAAAAADNAEPPDPKGWQTLELPIENQTQAAMLLLSLGPEFEIIAPSTLADTVRQMALSIAQQLTATPLAIPLDHR